MNYIFEKEQGLSFARNTGYKNTSSDWVAYLDDDAVVDKKWINVMLDVIDNYDFDAFGGVYLPWYRDGKESWFLDEYGSNLGRMNASSVIELKEKNFSGGNCVYRRSALIEIGGFSTDLGMSGNTLNYGEETLVQNKMRIKGYKLGFAPQLIIHHYVALYKQTFTWQIRKQWVSGLCYWSALGQTPSKIYSVVVFLMIPYFVFDSLLKSTISFFKKDYKVTNLVLDTTGVFLFQMARFIAIFRIKA